MGTFLNKQYQLEKTVGIIARPVRFLPVNDWGIIIQLNGFIQHNRKTWLSRVNKRIGQFRSTGVHGDVGRAILFVLIERRRYGYIGTCQTWT